ATMESIAGQALSVTSTGGANVTVGGSSGTRQIDVTDNDSATVAITTGTTAVTEGGSSVNVVATLTLVTNGAGTALLKVPVSVNLSGNADYSATAATFAVDSASGATANIAVAAVDDLFVEATTESITGQTLSVTDAGGANVTVGGSSGTRQIDV